MQTPHPKFKHQQGFTLLELLVVVSVLASLAGIAAVAMDGYEQDAQEQLVHVEMKRIANAIYRFKEDTGYFPEEGVFSSNGSDENLDWLFVSPEDGSNNEILPWNPNTGRGWHGPYITTESQQRYKIEDCDLGLPIDVEQSLAALADPFERKKTYTPASDDCFIVRNEGNWIPRDFAGMPYRYDLAYTNSGIPECSTSCVAVISAGKNSEFGETTNNDDIVTVLRAN